MRYHSDKNRPERINQLQANKETISVVFPDYEDTRSEVILNNGESKCVYNIVADRPGKFEVRRPTPNLNGNTYMDVFDKGDFIVEKCKSKTYSFK